LTIYLVISLFMWVVNPKKIILSSSTHYQVVLNAFIQLKIIIKWTMRRFFLQWQWKGNTQSIGWRY